MLNLKCLHAGIFRAIGHEYNQRFSCKDARSVNEFVSFNGRGEAMLRDRRSILKAELSNVSEKIRDARQRFARHLRASRAKTAGAAKAMGNFRRLDVRCREIASACSPHESSVPGQPLFSSRRRQDRTVFVRTGSAKEVAALSRYIGPAPA